MSTSNAIDQCLLEVKEYVLALTEGKAPTKTMQQINEYL